MQLIHPLSLGISTRTIEYRHRFRLCISAFLHVPFAQGERGTLWGQQSMWQFVATEMPVPLLDEGVVKASSEFLVHGYAFPPSGSAPGCAVRARLGQTAKEIHVFGKRHWKGRTASAPESFERMPLDWSRAFGGPGFEPNPFGVGYGKADAVRALPNLELPDSRITRPGQSIRPAGFGALASTHPQRAAWRGTYDDDWLRTDAPGFAPNLDWRHFNLALQDQWLASPLRGDEGFTLEHMHPARPRIDGQLPGLRARVMVRHAPLSEKDDAVWREVPMQLTTVWFFPHAERSILIFHGSAECVEDDAADVVSLLAAVERLGEMRADSHYLDVVARREDPVDGAIESLNDADLVPEGLDTVDPGFEQAAAAFRMEGLQADAQWRRAAIDVGLLREELQAQGRDPDAIGVKMPEREEPPSIASLAPYLKAKRREIEEMQWASVDELVTRALELLDDLGKAGKVGVTSSVQRGPPVDCPAGKRLAALQQQAAAVGQTIDVAALEPKLRQVEVAERLDYLQSAHLQAPAVSLQGEAADRARGEIEWMLAHGLRFFPGMDFTGADFSGLDLRDADFTGAWLESTNFATANVSGAIFGAAVLAHANLRNTIAVGTDFRGANLGRAQLTDAVFDRALFDGATLMNCDFTATQLRHARLGDANMLESSWGAADWYGVIAPGALFYKFDLRKVLLEEAELESALFVECDLRGSDLRGAKLRGAGFIGCRMDGVRLSRAVLDSAVFAQSCSVRNADFRQARLVRVNFGDCDWSRSSFAGAVLDESLLGASDLSHCDLHRASLRSVVARKSRLCAANLAGADLRDAILQYADLRRADLRAASLFGADLSRVRLDRDVKLDSALLARARTWPRLSPDQQSEYARRNPFPTGAQE